MKQKCIILCWSVIFFQFLFFIQISGGHLIKCLADNCDFSYPIQILKTLLNSQLTSLIFRRSAEEDLRLAGIENLKQCKYCDFQMVIDNPDEKLFQCRNPQCLKEYCLICEGKRKKMKKIQE